MRGLIAKRGGALSMGRKGFALFLAGVIALGGIFFPSGSLLTLTQGRAGVAGGWTTAGVRLAPPSLLAEAAEHQRQPRPTYGHLPLSFEANQGQTAPQVKFLARAGHRTVYFAPTEAVLV